MVLWLKALIVGVAIAAGVGVKYMIPNYKDDNPVEELVEEIINEETGLDFDLTPASREN